MATPSKNTIAEADYGAIEDALQSTEKGRRFLRAYTERNRSLETRRLLRSIRGCIARRSGSRGSMPSYAATCRRCSAA